MAGAIPFHSPLARSYGSFLKMVKGRLLFVQKESAEISPPAVHIARSVAPFHKL